MRYFQRYLRRGLRVLLILAATAALVGVAARQVHRKQQALSQAPKFGVGPLPVHAAPAQAGDLSQDRAYLAVVEPLQTAQLAARVTAEVERIACDEGDQVRAGQVMAVLDSREIRAHIAATQAQIEQSQADLQSNEATVETLGRSVEYWRRELARDQSLQRNNAIAISAAEVEATAEKLQAKQGELDSTKHRSAAIQDSIQSLKSDKQQLETTLDYCTIRSPFDGVVTRRLVDMGHLAAPGKVLFVVEDRSIVRLAFDVPQEDVRDVRPGLGVTFAAGEKSYHAKLSRLYPSLDTVRMMRAEVDFTGQGDAALTTGAYVPLSVTIRTVRGATLIPASSLVDSSASSGGPSRVFVVEDGRLALRPVTILGSRHNQLAVQGVKPGELVMTNTFLGWTRYAPGQEVEIVQ